MKARLAQQPHELIDRSSLVRFSFEGRTYEAYEGDTISSALWANGVRVLGRSFKYHRPRGIFSMADIDCNGMMESAAETNIRGDITPIEEGMNLRAVNTRGGVNRDVLGVLDRLSAFTPVGFYYKAFHTPRKLFPFYERRIREIAGLGAVNTSKRILPPPKDYGFCDLLVIGAGPSGLSAAVSAANAGADVLLVDEGPTAGGSFLYRHVEDSRLADLRDQVERNPRIELRAPALAAGYYSDHWVALVERTRLTKVRAEAVVIATGCYEQPAVFRNNDLPGVMLASAAQRLIRLYGVKPFTRVVILAANAAGYESAIEFSRAGVEVAAIVDLRPSGAETTREEELSEIGASVHKSSVIYEALAGPGKRSITGVRIGQYSEDGVSSPTPWEKIACDGIAMSVGWTPADGLLRQASVTMEYVDEVARFIPVRTPPGIFAAGSVNGIIGLDERMEDGRGAGLEAARELGFLSDERPSKRPGREGRSWSHTYPVFSHPRGKCFVDLDEDVTLKDIENAYSEGFDSPELLKRYATIGMGPSQGKHSNLLALRILSRLRGESMNGKQITTARPFISPVKLGHLAGRNFTTVRRTPVQSYHQANGAKFIDAGNWKRPGYFAVEGRSREDCIFSEAKNVREKAGLIDLGTLGKIEASGPDVVEFLQRVYTGFLRRMKVGTTRYGVLCDESGVVVDDGIVGRLAEDRFYISTTTTGSDAIYRTMQRCVIEWKLNVRLFNATSHYFAFNLAGPRAIEILRPLSEVELDPGSFPYLGLREGKVAGVPARLSRVGFVGEMGFEIHLEADGGLHAWNAIMEAGREFGLGPFGVEAQRLLRLEKGHIIVGQDTDGLTNPFEVGVSWAIRMSKPFFVGKRSLMILQKKSLLRELVGFTLPADYGERLPKECNLVLDKGEITGRVTSIGRSPALGYPIGLAYVAPSQKEPGTKLDIKLDDGHLIEATVARVPFFDPDNRRQKPDGTDSR